MARVPGRTGNLKRRGATRVAHITMKESDYNDLADIAKAANASMASVAEKYILAGMYEVPAQVSPTEKDLRQKIHDQKMRIEALERQAQNDATEIGQLNAEKRQLQNTMQSTDLTSEIAELKAKLDKALRRIGELSL